MYHGVTRDSSRPPKAPVEAASPGDPPEADAPEANERAEKKERVLHTRVPAVLEAELKRFAQSLRVPVSNLVRTILEDAVNVADAAGQNVESRLKAAAHQVHEERERLKKRVAPDPLRDVFAYQTVTLAQAATCAKCQTQLAPGDRAHMGLSDPPARPPNARVFVCDACVPRA